ncbi:MAG: glycosyltransferase family 2 protein [Thermoproteota archaeon]
MARTSKVSGIAKDNGHETMIPLTVIIIAQNEEPNIETCLKSVIGWAQEVYVVDAFSTDATPSLASALGAKVVQHEFINWAEQRNWALENLPIKTEWVFFLDADEVITYRFRDKLEQFMKLNCYNDLAGIYVRFRLWFLGKELRHAYEAPPVIRIIRKGFARWVSQGAREYCYLRGRTASIAEPIIHYDRKGISAWIDKQNRNATREAEEILRGVRQEVQRQGLAKYTERPFRTWVRTQVYSRIPGLLRPFLHFGYRYLIRGGFLDGYPGFIFCFLHAFWYPLLIDAKVKELQLMGKQDKRK